MDEKLKQKITFFDIQGDGEKFQADLKIPVDWPFFSGHFPQNPILPAVSIIDLSLLLLQRQSKDVTFQRLEISKSKFIGKVQPGHDVRISVQSRDGKSWEIAWTGKSDQSRLAQIHLTLTP